MSCWYNSNFFYTDWSWKAHQVKMHLLKLNQGKLKRRTHHYARTISPGVVNQWFPINWLQSIQSIIIKIVIDWCNQSIKIDTHTRSLNCYWLPLISIENHWLIIHYATFWRVLAWACFIGPGHIYTSFYPCTSTGIPRTHLLRSLLVPEMAKQVELSVRCVVKGYHECPFEVNVGEIFYAFKKRGERGNAFRVTNDRGQLGHLQIELVGPL